MIALLPLDDRPCNTRFPLQIARIGGDEILLPPTELLGCFNTPGRPTALGRWTERLPEVSALIVSIDMLAYGGLVASRKPFVSAEEALERLEILRGWRRARPDTPIFAFNILMRLAVTMDGDEAVANYYNVMRYARLCDEAERFDSDYLREERDKVKDHIPERVLDEYLQARARNHLVNLQMVDWLAENVFDYLLITQEDASEFGLHRQEQDHLLARVAALNVGAKMSLHPGADEAALTLLARSWNTDVSFQLHVSDASDMKNIAPFEDRPYEESLRQHVAAMRGQIISTEIVNEKNANAEISDQKKVNDKAESTAIENVETANVERTNAKTENAPDDAIINAKTVADKAQNATVARDDVVAKNAQSEADFVLFVNAPVGGSQKDESEEARAARLVRLQPFAERLIEYSNRANCRVALCDVAFPNGADNVLMTLLEERGALGKLVAFGAWNTAGNTTGTVLAQCAALQRALWKGEDTSKLNRDFTFERLIDDWFYQSQVRAKIERAAREQGIVPHNMGEQGAVVESQARRELRGFAQLLAKHHFETTLGASEITLPWNRAFEADVRMELV